MADSGEFDARPVRAFLPGPDVRADESAWPASVPGLAQVLRDGLELPAGLTVMRRVRPRWSYFLRADTMDLSLVVAWRQFMRDPQGFFRHLFEA